MQTMMKYTLHSTDEILIQGCLQQDRLAQKYLYQRFAGRMLGICMRYTNNREEAKEVLNIAFMKVFQSIKSYKEIGALSGWIAQIVFRTTIDQVRANLKYKEVMDFNIEKDKPIENEALSNLNTEVLYQLIQKLSPSAKTVFSMYVIDGYTHAEIAKELGISNGTSKWYLSEARKSLQNLFQKIDR